MKTSAQLLDDLNELPKLAKAKALELDPNAEWRRRQLDEYLIELGMTRGVAEDAIQTLKEAEDRLAIANKRLATWIDPADLEDIIGDFADYIAESELDHVCRVEARAWLQKQGYLPGAPMEKDTEATVGPIKDVGNPFETGIPA